MTDTSNPTTTTTTEHLLDEGADLIRHQAAEIEELRAALAPFAAFASESALMARPEDSNAWGFNSVTFTVADVRRARAALTGGTEEIA